MTAEVNRQTDTCREIAAPYFLNWRPNLIIKASGMICIYIYIYMYTHVVVLQHLGCVQILQRISASVLRSISGLCFRVATKDTSGDIDSETPLVFPISVFPTCS